MRRFGWPAEFVAAVGAWNFTSWSTELRERLCFRETDRVVHETVGRWPLSVSADRIALSAMRTFALLVRYGVSDRSGDKKFCEVYPAGSLSQWGLTSRGYKKNTPDHKQARENIFVCAGNVYEIEPSPTRPDQLRFGSPYRRYKRPRRYQLATRTSSL
jgi:Protein of unknown function (DUF429)